MDRRYLCQLTVLGLLTALPVTMIAINGIDAIHAILKPGELQDHATNGHPDSTSNKAGEEMVHQKLRFGVYDPSGVFAGDRNLKLRHIFVSWTAFDRKELAEALISLERQEFDILLTIEPWPKPGVEGPLLPEIARGHYDNIVDDLADILRKLTGPVYIAWGHEMDQDMTERYPWSGADPAQYIAAYRHVVDRLRSRVDTQLYCVWAGVLKASSLRYWPGEEYADFVGMPVYSFPMWDQQTYGFIRDFRTTFEEKREIVAGLNKPLMITELGVSGSADFESFWLHQAFVALQDYPDLAAVVFFYAKDSEGAWGGEVKTPDWRVNPDSIRSLVEWKLR